MSFYNLAKTLASFIVEGMLDYKIATEGSLPSKGNIIVANHPSCLDPIVLALALDEPVHFIAKNGFGNGVWGGFLEQGLEQIIINENPIALYRKIEKYLEDDKLVGIFPEGTRSYNEEPGEFDSGFIRLASRLKVPVIPVGINGTYDLWSRYMKIFRPRGKIRVRFGKPIYFERVLRKQEKKVNDYVREEVIRLAS